MNFYQDVFFRALDRARGRHNIERLHRLRASQFWERERLERWQLQRLNDLLGVARSHSPFHAERLADVALPLRSLEEFRNVPPLRKDEIRAHRDAIRTTHLPRARYGLAHTGGSTGEPTYFYLDWHGRDWNRASVYRSAEWAGTRLGMRAVDVSGSVHDRRKAATVRKRLADLALRHRHFSLVAPGAEEFESLRRLLNSYRPHSMWGYTSGIVGLAEHLEARGCTDDFSYLAAVVTSSETLLPPQRDTLERVFGAARLFDHYGSREMYIAAECGARDGYHLHADVVLAEILDDEGNPCPTGRPGRVIVTDLTNHAFPFIRYEIGDVAALAADEPCPCGVTLPKLARVEGRLVDRIALPDRVLTPPNFVVPLSAAPGVRAFQVRHERSDVIRVLIEADADFDAQARRRIQELMDGLVDGQARVEIVTDEPIEVPESGKRRFVVSNVADPEHSCAA